MKQVIVLLLISALGINAMSQDSLKTADTTKKFTEKLAEVTVTARRPMMIHEIDKTVVDVKAMAGSASLNTVELLERIPGVNVNPSGEISLNGKSGVLVLINDRPTYMSRQDLLAYLKSIPAGNLEKVELVDNPSAKYDAEGNAVINIKLRKNRAAGINGTITSGASLGRYHGTNNSVNLNFNRKKLNVFANLGLSTFKEYNDNDYDRKFFNADNSLSSLLKLDNDEILNTKNINLNTGFDYSISPKSSLGAIFNYNHGKRTTDFNFVGNNFDAAGRPGNLSSGYTDRFDTRNNLSFNINYLLQFNKEGHELTADANFLKYESGSNRMQGTFLSPANGSPVDSDLFQYIVPVKSDIAVFKADYVRPFKNKVRLEAGMKSSFINNDNVSDYFDHNGSDPKFEPAFSNHFRYDENINAAYFNLQKSWKRWQGQFGMRMESLHAEGNQLGNEIVEQSSFVKNNTGFFPSAYITYKLDTVNKNTLSLIAVRRISRPNYSTLNPFVFIKDEFTSISGNPGLNPQYQYRVELKFQHKQRYWFQLSFNKFTELIFNTTRVIDERYVNMPENIGKGYMILLSSGLTASPAKWLNTNNTLRIARLSARGNVADQPLRPDLVAVRFETMTFISITKAINAEFNAYWASKDIIGQAIAKPMFRMNAGVSKKMWKDKGTIRIGMDDIFHSWQYRNTSIALKQSSFEQTTVMDTRRVTASFSYRFGKELSSKKRRHGGVIDEEKGRLD
ncbi:MAG: outer membrane beta-barrel protein [Chitinophagaceae bacterium]|nr:outer membrane beta-barrel protein [Chitinophagaceae bacterium]